jgi:hypothetical protein
MLFDFEALLQSPCQLLLIFYDKDVHMPPLSVKHPVLIRKPDGWLESRLYATGLPEKNSTFK